MSPVTKSRNPTIKKIVTKFTPSDVSAAVASASIGAGLPEEVGGGNTSGDMFAKIPPLVSQDPDFEGGVFLQTFSGRLRRPDFDSFQKGGPF